MIQFRERKISEFLDDNFWIWSLIGAVLLWIATGVATANFNLSTLIANITSASFLSLAALGQMIVITSGRGAIDLSIPSVITLAAFLTMGTINGENAQMPLGVVLIILTGGLIGLVNSFLVIYIRITPMIATLAMGYILSTASLIYNRGFSAFKVAPIFFTLNRQRFLGIPLVVFVIAIIIFMVFFMMNRMIYGQSLMALGQNKKAALYAGIKTNLIEILAYVFCSILAALTGMFLSARVGGAFLGMGDTYLLDTVASVVIGGTLMSGGRASVIGTILGALFLSFLITAMQVANLAIGTQNIVKGLLIILVLLIGTATKVKNK